MTNPGKNTRTNFLDLHPSGADLDARLHVPGQLVLLHGLAGEYYAELVSLLALSDAAMCR
jgi:hypothetical protein